jgi:hypothetical protein
MNLPDYLSYYFREGQKRFDVLTDLDPGVAEHLLKNDVLWRSDGTYLSHRRMHEQLLRGLFIEKGGHPHREHPIYAILGESPIGPHDLENEYAYKIKIPLRMFTRDDVSFTYPDSLYEVPLSDLGRLHLERNRNPTVHTIEEIGQVIKLYRVFEINNHYIEAQIWNEKHARLYADKSHWIRCIKR